MVLLAVAVIPLVANGITEAWLGYRDQRVLLHALLRTEAEAAAEKISRFLHGIEEQLSWTVRFDWTAANENQHHFDALGVLRQVPAVVSITLVDEEGMERLYISRIDMNRVSSGMDRSRDPAVAGARSGRTWYGPVVYYHDSEPFMSIAVAGNRRVNGVAIAEINLKLIWDVVSVIRVGETGRAFVVDRSGRLIAHPDISLVLRAAASGGSDGTVSLRHIVAAADGRPVTASSRTGEAVVVAAASIEPVGWVLAVEQPLAEAFAPIYAALWRTSGFLLATIVVAGLLAYWLAHRMIVPIRVLEEGVERIGAGQFDHQISVSTGDELGRLSERFNRMANELGEARGRAERIAKLRQFLAPQVAELVESRGDSGALAAHRAEVVVVFCDLRGFTAFSAQAQPEEIMSVLAEYHQALGPVIALHAATLTGFSGDGLMILLNAPVPCHEPALRAVEMAIEMQQAVQNQAEAWRTRGHTLGFGVGLAMGAATVGQIGYEGRVEYTAIGNVVNLASRLCSSAINGQILVDAAIAEVVRDRYPIAPLGARNLKGYDRLVAVFAVTGWRGHPQENATAAASDADEMGLR